MKYKRPMNPAGFCKQKGWDLSYRQIQIKGCIDPEKQCSETDCGKTKCIHFRAVSDHPIWGQLEKERQIKKERRERKKKQNLELVGGCV